MGDVAGRGEVGYELGRAGLGLYRGGGNDPGPRSRLFPMGLVYLCGECECIWMGIVDARDCGAGGVQLGVCACPLDLLIFLLARVRTVFG